MPYDGPRMGARLAVSYLCVKAGLLEGSLNVEDLDRGMPELVVGALHVLVKRKRRYLDLYSGMDDRPNAQDPQKGKGAKRGEDSSRTWADMTATQVTAMDVRATQEGGGGEVRDQGPRYVLGTPCSDQSARTDTLTHREREVKGLRDRERVFPRVLRVDVGVDIVDALRLA